MKYNLPAIIVASVLAVFLFGVALFDHRPTVLAQSPAVIHTGEATLPPDMGDMVGVIDEYGVHIPTPPSKFELALRHFGVPLAPASYANMSKPMIGYSVQEWSFLGMPFGWTKNDGDVVYVTYDSGVNYAPMWPERWAEINKLNGRDVTAITIRPFWNHTWGWLYVLGWLFAGWLYQRGNARRREELGLID